MRLSVWNPNHPRENRDSRKGIGCIIERIRYQTWRRVRLDHPVHPAEPSPDMWSSWGRCPVSGWTRRWRVTTAVFGINQGQSSGVGPIWETLCGGTTGHEGQISPMVVENFSIQNKNIFLKRNLTIDDYRPITTFHFEINIKYHSYQLPENRNLSIIIRNLPVSITEVEIYNYNFTSLQ